MQRLRLKGTVGRTHPADETDVHAVKNALTILGERHRMRTPLNSRGG